MSYDCVNTLRFVLAHGLRTDYGMSPADYQGLFQRDSLEYWWKTGRSGEDILREVAGVPRLKERRSA